MFESIQPSKRRRPRLIIILSIAAHAAALFALVVTALWQVDKLGVADAPLLVAGGPGAPMSSGEEDQAAPKKPKKPKKPHPTNTLAPTDQSTAEPDDSGGGESTGTGGGDGEGPGDGDGLGTSLFPCGEGGSCSVLEQAEAPSCGNGKIEGAEECDDGNRAAGDGCSTTCRLDQERVVVAHLIEGSRIKGDPKIAAPDSVRQQMARAGTAKVEGMVKMCLDRQGRVRSLRLLKSTGYSEYDQRLLAGMRSWGYEPYRLDTGAAVPVCTVVTFIYRVQ